MKTLLLFASFLFAFVSTTTLDRQAFADNAPLHCSIQTYYGYYLTAVGGGGRISDVIHSDARSVRSWEVFTLVDSGLGTPNITYGIRTYNGHYLTAIGGGGFTGESLHSDATQLREWEQFQMISLGNGWYGIQTRNGHFLTAVGGGGRTQDVIHTNATSINSWEKFRLSCWR